MLFIIKCNMFVTKGYGHCMCQCISWRDGKLLVLYYISCTSCTLQASFEVSVEVTNCSTVDKLQK